MIKTTLGLPNNKSQDDAKNRRTYMAAGDG